MHEGLHGTLEFDHLVVVQAGDAVPHVVDEEPLDELADEPALLGDRDAEDAGVVRVDSALDEPGGFELKLRLILHQGKYLGNG